MYNLQQVMQKVDYDKGAITLTGELSMPSVPVAKAGLIS